MKKRPHIYFELMLVLQKLRGGRHPLSATSQIAEHRILTAIQHLVGAN